MEVSLSPVNYLMVTSTAKVSLSLIVWHSRDSTASPSWMLLKSAVTLVNILKAAVVNSV